MAEPLTDDEIAYLSTCTDKPILQARIDKAVAELLRLRAERDGLVRTLRGIVKDLEIAGEQVAITEAERDEALRRAEKAEAVPPGRCPLTTPGIWDGVLTCDLRAGHAGLHHDQAGTDWGRTIPYDLEGDPR